MKTILQIGGKYNSWTICAFDGVDEKRRRRYLCQCDCGIKKSLAASAVAAGRTKCCNSCKVKKLDNQLFGDWTVVCRGSNSKDGKARWMCRCSCGNERLVVGGNLVRGISKCCFECGHNKTISTVQIPSSWWYKTMDQARSRNIEWDLTEDVVLKILKEQDWKCALTGMEISFKPMTASLGRIDSDKHYFADNVQWVHKHINIMKHRYEQDYFISMCKLVAENHRVVADEQEVAV